MNALCHYSTGLLSAAPPGGHSTYAAQAGTEFPKRWDILTQTACGHLYTFRTFSIIKEWTLAFFSGHSSFPGGKSMWLFVARICSGGCNYLHRQLGQGQQGDQITR